MHDNDFLRDGWVSCLKGTRDFPVVHWDCAEQRDKNKWLLLQDIVVRARHNYDISVWNNYKGVITWNSKLYSLYKDSFNMRLWKGFPYIKQFIFKDHINYESKKKGASLVATFYPPYSENDPLQKRYEVCSFLSKSGYTIDCYGSKPFKFGCESFYKGGASSKIKTISEYKFNICFENCYDELYSWDYVTEKIYDCFCAKTIPIYYGAYNIEEIIPKKLFIDFRDYKNNLQGLYGRLEGISKQEYTDMVDSAYDFYNNTDLYWYVENLKSLWNG